MSHEPNPHQAPGQTAPANDHETAPDHPPFSGRKAGTALVLVLILIVGLAIWGIWKRHHNDDVLARTTQQEAAPSVIALAPQPGRPQDNFVLPGNVTAWSDAPIYARTSGYLTKWYYDIGAHVKKGALLAQLSAPEVDQQLAQSEADLVTAQTNAGNATNQAKRYQGLVASDAVSQQDTETFTTQAASASSAVKSAQANVQRLKELQGFEKIYAPFDGVVTARGVDTGQLVSQGGSSELFHLQSLQTLRVYANIPEVYTGSIQRGEKIALTFPQFPGRTFQGTLVRTADAIDPANRTLLVEIDIDNRKGELMPGALAQVHFRPKAAGQTFIVPASALIFRHEGLRIGTVDSSGVAHLLPITIGQDNGATVEVIAGLHGNDRVIQDPPDSLIEGQRVQVEQPSAQNEAENPTNPQPPAGQPQGKPSADQNIGGQKK